MLLGLPKMSASFTLKKTGVIAFWTEGVTAVADWSITFEVANFYCREQENDALDFMYCLHVHLRFLFWSIYLLTIDTVKGKNESSESFLVHWFKKQFHGILAWVSFVTCAIIGRVCLSVMIQSCDLF